MFSRDHRLQAQDIVYLHKHGKRIKIDGLFFIYQKKNESPGRIAIVVGKKYHLSAVKRNKQRRIIQAAFAAIYPKTLPHYDLIMTYTDKGKVLSYKEAKGCMESFGERIINEMK